MIKEIVTDTAAVTIYSDRFNKRIRVDDYSGDLKEVLFLVDQHISEWVEKLIVKSRAEDVSFFSSNGFSSEALVKGYFSGKDMHFVCKYFSIERSRSEHWSDEQTIIEKLINKKTSFVAPDAHEIKIATVSQAGGLTRLYNEVFSLYPTPLGDEDHIKKTMYDGTVYAYIENDGRMVSAASAEINLKFKNAELTDCATLPAAEGKGHMKKLLFFLEQKLRPEGTGCFYSIARAESFSMNKAFSQLGYTYGGRLVKNCLICSGLEDMNVWHKSI